MWNDYHLEIVLFHQVKLFSKKETSVKMDASFLLFYDGFSGLNPSQTARLMLRVAMHA